MSTPAMLACFYCGMPSRHTEQDHAPIAARHGGTQTVTACINCHDLKDRIPVDHWPVSLLMQALEECGPLGRIYLAKCFAIGRDVEEEAAIA